MGSKRVGGRRDQDHSLAMQRTIAARSAPRQGRNFNERAGDQERHRARPARRVRSSAAGVRVSLTIFKELASQTGAHFPKFAGPPQDFRSAVLAASSQDGFETMIELDILSGEINALMSEQREAWRELARPTLTAFDRREIRNRIKQGEIELRDHLKVRTDRLRFQPRLIASPAGSFANIEFRLF